MWGPVQREAAAAAKAAEAQGPQQQPTTPRPAAQPSAPDYGQAHGLPMQHGQGGGRLHLGGLAAALLGIAAGAASAVAAPVFRGGGGGGGGGGRGRGRRR